MSMVALFENPSLAGFDFWETFDFAALLGARGPKALRTIAKKALKTRDINAQNGKSYGAWDHFAVLMSLPL
jgi:hypothetical protein